MCTYAKDIADTAQNDFEVVALVPSRRTAWAVLPLALVERPVILGCTARANLHHLRQDTVRVGMGATTYGWRARASRVRTVVRAGDAAGGATPKITQPFRFN